MTDLDSEALERSFEHSTDSGVSLQLEMLNGPVNFSKGYYTYDSIKNNFTDQRL